MKRTRPFIPLVALGFAVSCSENTLPTGPEDQPFIGSPAFDDIPNNLDATVDATAEVMALTFPGPDGTTQLYVVPQNGDGKNGCNLTGSATLVVSVSSSDELVATVSPSPITFGSCGDAHTLTVTPTGVGSATISLSETSNSTEGTFNLEPAKFTVVVSAPPPSDVTPPVITPNVSGTLGNNGWYVSDVTVTWSVVDNESPISSSSGCDEINITADQAATTYTCEATSAGGTASESVTIKRDATAPIVSLIGGPANGGSYYFGSVPAAPTCSASDALSGLDGACVVTGYSNAVGSHTVAASAMDEAGNSGSASASYTVLSWTLYGFYQPVEMGADVWNTVKGGATVPLKFEIFAGATELTSTGDINSFKTEQVACTGGGLEEAVDIVTTGGTSLRYDAVAGQFVQNWQTPKQPGRCYKVTMTTLDGSTLEAFFKLK